MAAASTVRVNAARASVPEDDLRASLAALEPARRLRLPNDEFAVIAEIKRASPSAGRLAAEGLDPVGQAKAYERGGAVALSVLTEPDYFHGSLADVEAVANAVDLPVMRKDFLVDPYQVLEARHAGASGVLLIAGMLPREVLVQMAATARDLGMFALVEAFSEDDLADTRALVDLFEASSDWLLAGINSRNLKSLDVDPARFASLAPALPAGVHSVAESGLATPDDARRVAELGYSMALVGTALMVSGHPEQATRDMILGGREGMRSCP